MKSACATSSCRVYQSARSSKRTGNLHRARAVFSMRWKVKTRKRQVGVAAEVEVAVAVGTAATARALACRIVAGAPERVIGHPRQQMARTIPATGHGARLRLAQLLLWGRMVVSVLVVVASPRIECSHPSFHMSRKIASLICPKTKRLMKYSFQFCTWGMVERSLLFLNLDP